jgi:predicted nucleic acid-binding protein
MTVVLDTNVVLQARAVGHDYHPILQGLLAGEFILAASTPFLLEYEEILTAQVGAARWKQFAAALDTIAAWHRNVRQVEPAFR